MKAFNPIHRDYTAPADLGVLERTYNTLEQGHKEAVSAASELKAAVANLDLNESESEWRQNYINDIEYTIQSNTVDGNSYAALNEIIAKSGNIFSDAGMIGRLNAQKDYKEYLNNITNSNIPEEYKDYYREKNQYYYEDQINDKGQVIGGTKWNPTERPVDTIPLNELVIKGISIAAKESGGGSSTRWLDVNGNVTSNPNEVFDGEIYNQTTSQWERLSKDKITQGILSMIETTPGAKASLEQDYKIAQWKYNKNGEFNPDYTDKNGMPLSFNDYISKRINPAIEAANYYNSVSSSTYGNGLKTYKTANKAARNAVDANQQLSKSFDRATNSTPITVSYDHIGNLQGQKQNSFSKLNDIYKSFTGEDLALDINNINVTELNRILSDAGEKAKINGVTNDIVTNNMLLARRALRDFREANDNYNQIVGSLNDDQKAATDFISRMNSGANFNAENKYDAEMINATKKLFSDNTNSVRAIFKDKASYANAISTLGGGDKEGFKNLGFKTGYDKDGNQYIELAKDNYNQAYLFSQTILNEKNKIGIFSNAFSNPIDVQKYDEQGNKIIESSRRLGDSPISTNANVSDMRKIVSTYNSINKKVSKTLNDKVPSTITFDNKSFRFSTIALGELYDEYKAGIVSGADFIKIKDIQTEDDINKITNHDYTQTDMFTVKNKNNVGTLEREENTQARAEIGNEIKHAINNKLAKYSAAHNAVYGTGTNITIYGKVDKEGKPFGEAKQYFIPNLLLGDSEDRFNNSSIIKAVDKISIGNEIKNTYYFTDITEGGALGEQSIKCLGNEQFIYKNDLGEFNVNRSGAVTIANALEEYNQIKDGVQSGFIYSNTTSQKEIDEINIRLGNSLLDLASKISNSADGGRTANIIIQQMLMDLNK